VAIVGSQEFPDLEAVRTLVRGLPEGSVVVSGGARGVDRTAEEAARERGLEVVVIRANWKKFGRSAGMRRNPQIVAGADEVHAFWDGFSNGTANTIAVARRNGQTVVVHRTSD
jgi:predicted Rossmann-fold nucleotide-binding protein